MKRLAAVCLCLLVTGCAARVDSNAGTLPDVRTAPTAISEVPVPMKLSPHAEDVLAKAQQNGVTSVALVISADAGATERVATALRDLGATVEATDTSIGYLRVSVPIADVKRVTTVDGVRRVDVDEPIGQPDPKP